MKEKVNVAVRRDRVVDRAGVWRDLDKEAIADRTNRDKQRAEYRARNALREAVDLMKEDR